MEREKLIEAAKVLKDNCEQRNGKCEGCPFLDGWDYPMRRKTPSFSSGDISRVLRIYVSN